MSVTSTVESSANNNGSYFIERERIYPFFNPTEMNSGEGLSLAWETDPAIARRVLPPMFELLNPEHAFVTAYVVNVREPTFAPWYMEGGVGLLCRHGETTGLYYLNLQLSGPGAAMGLLGGREFSGLPKKMCERIVVERTGNSAHAFIEAKGRRIFDVQVEIGSYNTPVMQELYSFAKAGAQTRGSCFLFMYQSDHASDGHVTFPTMDLMNYDSITDYQTWEPAHVTSITMEPSLDDPWAELVVLNPLGGAYNINSNRVATVSNRVATVAGSTTCSATPAWGSAANLPSTPRARTGTRSST